MERRIFVACNCGLTTGPLTVALTHRVRPSVLHSWFVIWLAASNPINLALWSATRQVLKRSRIVGSFGFLLPALVENPPGGFKASAVVKILFGI
jgi:hypothetical protein